MLDIQKLLEETRQQLEELSKEAETYRSARKMHEESSSALDRACEALREISQKVKPITDAQITRFRLHIFIALGINALLTAAVLFMLLMK